MSTITNGIQKGVISRISVESNANGKRFVISILVMATATERARYEYFSTPLSSPESVRINAQQLRNAFPELMGVNPDDAVFLKMLTNRSRFVNRDISFSVTPQVDKVTRAPKLDPKTNRPYTNVRIEASGEDMSEQDALALLSGAITTPTTDGVPAGDHNDDIPM